MENILAKIKKLFSHQKSAEKLGSIHEAEAFAAKIQKLLIQYNLSLKDISFEERKENITQSNFSCKIPSVSDTLGYSVFYPIAKWNLCRVYAFDKDGKNALIIGTSENIEICKMIYEVVLEIFLREGKRKYKIGVREQGLDTYLREFLRGCAKGLDLKFKSEREEIEKKEIGTSALVIVNDKAVVDYVQTKFKMAKSRSQTYKRNDAFYDGVQTGRNVELNKKVNGK